ncbi:MAG: SLC13 family permease [Nannocystaceae bacterium]|nr:SLC13 family permease [Nannocystaceae bacterium]
MTFAVAVTFVVLAAVIAGLTLTRVSPDMVLLGGLASLLVAGVLTPAEAFGGFSNEGLATIAALFIVAEGLRRTGGVNFVGLRLLGRPSSLRAAQLRLMAPVAALSAFLNNTPVVAMMMPVVSDWARRRNLSVSKLLLPLSYASILGGLVTLVGTSTTLVVNGLMLATPGQEGFSMFDMAWVGIPAAVVGLIYIPIASKWLLPDRRPAHKQLSDPREYVVEMVVQEQSPIVGTSVEDAGLRSLPGMYLMEIQRGRELVIAAEPTTRLQALDRLMFVGIVESVVDLQKVPGLVPAPDQLFKVNNPRSHRCLIEAVVGGGRLAGQTVREAKFRTHYNAVIIAVSRDGDRVKKKVGDIRLQSGDTLLIEGHPSFVDTHRNAREFLLVSSVDDSTPVTHERAWIARALMLLMVVLAATEATSMLKAACIAGGGMVAFRCLRPSHAKRAIDLSVLLGIGAGLGIGVAMDRSGAAAFAATALLESAGTNPTVALATIYVITTILANLITTQAAAVLVFPVALATAEGLGVNFMPFAVSLTVAAAAAFATPVGYQTNLMVYGPGGYRSSDFLRIGAPLSLLVWITTVIAAPLAFPFH